MKTKITVIIALTALILILCGCAAGQAPAAEPTPSPTPVPTPPPPPPPEKLILTVESAEDILACIDMPSLKEVDGTNSAEYEALLELYKARPDCRVTWNYEFEGTVYPNDTESLKAESTEGLADAIKYLPALTYVDLIDTDATVEDLDAYSEINPNIDFYWEFIFDGWRIRTDIECYSSLRDLNYHRFTDEELYPMLRYCRHLKALDLGHNDVRDVTLIGQLTQLQVLILADNPELTDASALANLTDLEYLEFFMNHKVEDYGFLDSLTKLKDLNLCYCDNLGDLDFLENMPDMLFGMFKYSGIEQDELDYWKERMPDAKLVIYDGSIHSCEGGWRSTARNANIRRAFTMWPYVTDYPDYNNVTLDTSHQNYRQYY